MQSLAHGCKVPNCYVFPAPANELHTRVRRRTEPGSGPPSHSIQRTGFCQKLRAQPPSRQCRTWKRAQCSSRKIYFCVSLHPPTFLPGKDTGADHREEWRHFARHSGNRSGHGFGRVTGVIFATGVFEMQRFATLWEGSSPRRSYAKTASSDRPDPRFRPISYQLMVLRRPSRISISGR